MSYKNTVKVTDINGQKYTLHFVNHEHDVECQIYPLGNRHKPETIAIFDKDALHFERIGKEHEYPRAKLICSVLLQRAFNIQSAFMRMFYKKLTIVPLGKMDFEV